MLPQSDNDRPALALAPPPMGRTTKVILWIALIAGILGAGTAFTYKVAEFIYTIGSEEVKGFADVPVATYFFVAAGWLFLLVWSFRTGKFKDIESSKWEMLKQEAEYERRGE